MQSIFAIDTVRSKKVVFYLVLTGFKWIIFMFSSYIPHWWNVDLQYAHGLTIHQESFHWMFVIMGFWLVLLGQGTLNALILIAIKSYYFKEDVRSWKRIIFFNFILTIAVYGAVLMLYQFLNQLTWVKLDHWSTTMSIISYIIGQITIILYSVHLAKKLDV